MDKLAYAIAFCGASALLIAANILDADALRIIGGASAGAMLVKLVIDRPKAREIAAAKRERGL
jgi:hypothetical protein